MWEEKFKAAYGSEAEPYIDEARATLEYIESQVQNTLSVQNTRINMGDMNMFHDIIMDGPLTDVMVQSRLLKMKKSVEKAHEEVRRLKRKCR